MSPILPDALGQISVFSLDLTLDKLRSSIGNMFIFISTEGRYRSNIQVLHCDYILSHSHLSETPQKSQQTRNQV